MGALALSGLGRAPEEVLRWHARYCERLDDIASAPGRYRSALEEVEHDLERQGSEAVLAERLPKLISGWARSAYHPLIRLAYGYAFQIQAEIAAGLAYLTWC